MKLSLDVGGYDWAVLCSAVDAYMENAKSRQAYHEPDSEAARDDEVRIAACRRLLDALSAQVGA